MNPFTIQRLPRRIMTAGLLILLLSAAFSNWLNAQASPAAQLVLPAIQDSYTDLNAANTNFDASLLTAANSPGVMDEDDVTTKQVLLKFDLSNVGFEIKTAILRLNTLTCNGLVPVDALPLAVHGVDNDQIWDGSSLTWNNQPALSTGILATLDAGRAAFNQAQTLTWSDTRQGDLATWLETQRQAHNQHATLVVLIPIFDQPGLGDIFFEDLEGTGAAYGCLDSLGGPTLELRDTIQFNLLLPLLKR